MKRNLRRSILYVLIIVLLLINTSCQPDYDYSSETDFQDDIVQDEPEPQEQSVAMEPMVIFDNINTNPNSNFPPIPPTFTLTESWRITSILVMHWNHGEGAEPGEITILDGQYNVYGTWQAEGVAPEPQFPDTYWVVRPDLVLGPGTYTLYDSDPETQSYNTESGDMGMVRVKGSPLNDQPGSFIANNEEGADYTLEEMQVKGVVSLPAGSGLSFSELSVITLTETAPVEADGVFRTTSLHASDAPQLAMALNQQGNPVLMGVFGASDFDGYGMSVESTARAFVLFDMAVLSLAPEKRAIIAAALDKHPAYPALQEMVAQAIIDDPVDPLLGDNNAGLYELAARMTADLLNQAKLLPRASGNSGFIPISFTQDSNDIYNTGYIDVEDDKKFSPKVVLVNKTWAYYKVNIRVDDRPWTLAGSPTIYLVRNNLYGTINIEWPPVSYRSIYEPEVGDGMLSFTFTHDKPLTLLDLFMTTASTVMGVGEIKTGDKGLRLLLSFKSTFADGIRDLMQAFPQHQQMSFTEAVATYSWAIGFNGGKLLLDVSEAMIKEEISNAVGSGLVKKAFKFILKKAAKPITLAYGSADMAAIIYSYNSAPESAVFKGEQRFGIYPAIEMKCMAETDEYTVGKPISFSRKIKSDLPEGLKLHYEWDFNDGMVSTSDFGDTTHHGGWVYGPEYAFQTDGIYDVKVTAMAEDRPVAECIIQVEIGAKKRICPIGDNPCLEWNGYYPLYFEDGTFLMCIEGQDYCGDGYQLIDLPGGCWECQSVGP